MPQLRQIWDNAAFFAGSDDPRIAEQVQELKGAIASLAEACGPFVSRLVTVDDLEPAHYPELIGAIQPIQQQQLAMIQQLGNVSTFIYSVLSVDAQDTQANTWMPTIQQLWADLDQALKPLEVFLTRSPQEFVDALVAAPGMADMAFGLERDRLLRDQLLDVAAEQLVAGLGVHGLHTWGNLYRDLAGSLQCEIQGESVGLAKAANLLSAPARETRAAAWHGIQTAWESRQETVATILNAINGWRLEETKHRSRTRSLHYLDKSCHQSGIERATLNVLMETAYRHRQVGQRALKAMAQALQLPQMAPWDLFAPAPVSSGDAVISFDEAIALIADAFGQLSPAMGDFVVMMAEKGWIDAEPTPRRTTGAYCTQFSQPREPRVFMTYEGSMGNVTTLAHELGHAWHNWTMRDLSLLQTRYPMTLAETASVFGETLVRKALLRRAQTPAQQLEILWQDAESAAAFLVNIPARFEFEQSLVEARKQGYVITDRLRQMMRESWAIWYEDSLSEYDELFWASKLHFSISSLGFYNYPYLFGYLFSLGIYAQWDRFGDRFFELYTAILRDTGRMTAEDLVMHHLQQDIRQPEFWEASLGAVEQAIAQFEQLVASPELTPALSV